MTHLDPLSAARHAVSTHPDRPATAILHDSADVRLIVFRLGPGQAVALHRSSSSVQLTVLQGNGVLSGESDSHVTDRECTCGDVVVYLPNELHGMRAGDEALLLLATITPRPGGAH